MEAKFFNELLDPVAHGDLRKALGDEREQMVRESLSIQPEHLAGENRAARRAREQQERRAAKRKQPA